MSEAELLLTLHLLPGLGAGSIQALYQSAGSAAGVLKGSFAEPLAPAVRQRFEAAMRHWEQACRRAQEELDFARQHRISLITAADANYPTRLRHCIDAPLFFFYRGHDVLQSRRIIAVVGTRNITDYGKDMCDRLLADLAAADPHLLVVSGLAYGVDIHAHRAALRHGLRTVGVLAHGFDRIYPHLHKQTAGQMLTQGGLLTEYLRGTKPDKGNFIRRNRIVAGLCDACLVIESAIKGGALVTARLAKDYNREVLACPGRSTDAFSAGCNKLIARQEAAILTSAEDLLTLMNWENKAVAAQATLFPALTPDEERIVAHLQGSDGTHINQIVTALALPFPTVSAALFQLELKGLVKAMVGSKYKLR